MVTKIMQKIEEINDAFQKFAQFHDDYFAGIEIKFDDYKSMNDKGESTGIKEANGTVILYVNTSPYGKEHGQIVRIECKDVKSFDISTPVGDDNMWWGIMQILPRSESDNITIEVEFIAGKAKLTIVCSSILMEYDEKGF